MKRINSIFTAFAVIASAFSLNIDNKISAANNSEEIVRKFIENKSVWSEKAFLSNSISISEVGFIDLDLDGTLELFVYYQEGSGRYTYYDFYKLVNEKVEKIATETFHGHENGMQDSFSQLYYDKASDQILYCGDDYERISGREYVKSECSLFYDKSSNTVKEQRYCAQYIMGDYVSYYDLRSGAKNEISESEYSNIESSIKREWTNLNLSYKMVDVSSLSSDALRNAMLESYNSFKCDYSDRNTNTEPEKPVTENNDKTDLSQGEDRPAYSCEQYVDVVLNDRGMIWPSKWANSYRQVAFIDVDFDGYLELATIEDRSDGTSDFKIFSAAVIINETQLFRCTGNTHLEKRNDLNDLIHNLYTTDSGFISYYDNISSVRNNETKLFEDYDINIKAVDISNMSQEEMRPLFIESYKGFSYSKKENNSIKGDINQDGTINSIDIVQMKQWMLNEIKVSESQINNSDINQDGKINVIDYILLINIFLTGF